MNRRIHDCTRVNCLQSECLSGFNLSSRLTTELLMVMKVVVKSRCRSAFLLSHNISLTGAIGQIGQLSTEVCKNSGPFHQRVSLTRREAVNPREAKSAGFCSDRICLH